MNKAGFENEYAGIGRLQYFLAHVGLIVVAVFIVTVFGPNSGLMSVATLALMVASLILDVMRLRNIGASDWFAMIRFLPFGKSILWIGLTSAQTGWIETRRLDSAGKSILLVELLLLALIVFIAFRTRVMIPIFM